MKKAKGVMEPQNAIAILALIISILTFCWATINQKAQDDRWDELNTGKIEYVESKVIMWGEFTQDEVYRMDWGYKPVLYSVIENELHMNKYRIPYGLVLIDSINNSIILGTGFSFTVKDMQERIKAYNLDDSKTEIKKNFQCKFVFLNSGNTPNDNVKMKISCGKETRVYEVVLHETSDRIKMYPGKKVMVQTNFFIPINEPVPDKLFFKIEVEYDDFLRKNIAEEWLVVFYSHDGTWKFGD